MWFDACAEIGGAGERAMIRILGTLLFLLAPPVLVAILLWRFPSCRRFRWRPVFIYVFALTLVITGALKFVAWVAGGRVILSEIPLILWFAIGWRTAWELWRRTVGRLGERWIAASRDQGWGIWKAYLVRVGIPLGRIALTSVVFLTLFLSTVLTHRFKIADGHDPESVFGRAYEHVRIPTADGLILDGWFVPEKGSDRTIVVCHGAGANKGNFIWFLGPLAGEGYNIVLFDFRAHGASEGRTTTYGIREQRDVQAVIDWLKCERPNQAHVIVGLGSSQGAMALALAAAEDRRIDALILDSPFVSPYALAMHHAGRVPLIGRPLACLILAEMSAQTGTNFFSASAEQAVAQCGSRPVLVIHGADDILMPAEHARRLFEAATGPRELWFGPGIHSNIVTAVPGEYARRVFGFLKMHLGPPVALRVPAAS